MRNPKRIGAFLSVLKRVWSEVPDWRFGQLMSNFLGWYVTETKRDIFFPEDDEMLEYLKRYEKEVIGIECEDL